jgi:hypothetical protein
MNRGAPERRNDVKRADELFVFEERPSGSAFVTKTWGTRSEPEESFVSVAVCQWEMVVTRQGGRAFLTVRGPETRATAAPIPTDAEFFGIQFALGTSMPGLDLPQLVDGALDLPPASRTSCLLGGSEWDLPGPDDADSFVTRLARAGLLVHDPVAAAAVAGEVTGLSPRSLERRVRRATGLSRGTILQIRRAERAVDLLTRGMAPRDVARHAGYADQPHLTRSLTRYVGQTPARIAAGP